MLKILLNDASNSGKYVIISLLINSSDMPSIPGDLPFVSLFKACIISHDVMLLFSMLFAISCFILNGGFSSFQLLILFSRRLLSICPCGGVLCFKKTKIKIG